MTTTVITFVFLTITALYILRMETVRRTPYPNPACYVTIDCYKWPCYFVSSLDEMTTTLFSCFRISIVLLFSLCASHLYMVALTVCALPSLSNFLESIPDTAHDSPATTGCVFIYTICCKPYLHSVRRVHILPAAFTFCQPYLFSVSRIPSGIIREYKNDNKE